MAIHFAVFASFAVNRELPAKNILSAKGTKSAKARHLAVHLFVHFVSFVVHL